MVRVTEILLQVRNITDMNQDIKTVPPPLSPATPGVHVHIVKVAGGPGWGDGKGAGGRGGAPDGGSSAAEPASDGQEEERRYALNGEPYSCEDFKRYYGAQWTDMWSKARAAGAAGPSEEAVGSLQGARAADGGA